MKENAGVSLKGLLRVVIADDSPLVLAFVRDLFEDVGATVYTISSAIGLSGLVRRVKPDGVVLDINMPAIRGDEAVLAVRRALPGVAIVLYSDDPKAADYAHKAGVPWIPKKEPGRLVSCLLEQARRELGKVESS